MLWGTYYIYIYSYLQKKCLFYTYEFYTLVYFGKNNKIKKSALPYFLQTGTSLIFFIWPNCTISYIYVSIKKDFLGNFKLM